MPLYGNELGPDVTPFEAGLGRVVKFDKPGEFIGREALAARASSGPTRRLAGLTVQSRRIARHGYPVLADGEACGPSRAGPRPPPSACRSRWRTWSRGPTEMIMSWPSASGALSSGPNPLSLITKFAL